MADNTQVLDPTVTGAGGDTIATDDIGGVKFQRIKLIHGADGVNDGDVSSANPLPVEIVTAVAVTGPLTDDELRATAVPVSGPLTDAQLRASAVAVESSAKNFISIVNSTAIALSAGGVFTGPAEDVTLYDSIIVAAKTDQNGTFTVQFSNDGTNWDSTLARYYRTDQIEAPHRFTIARKYARISFTNTSASAQTYLRLQTTFGSKTALNTPLDALVAQDYDAIQVRPTDYHYEVALGRRQGATTWNVYGNNSDIDSAASETIWTQGGTFVRLSSASTFTIVSTSVEDTLTTGTGAWNVIIYYIDANRIAKTVVVPLNGTTNVVTSVSGLGINRVAVYNSGSSDANVGTITVSATVGGSVQAHVPAGEGSSQQAIFFTQDSHTLLVDWLFINVNKTSGGGSPRITVTGWVYSYVSTAKYKVFYDVIDTAVENHVELRPTHPFVIGERSILWFEASTTVNDSIVSCRFSGIEVRDVDA